MDFWGLDRAVASVRFQALDRLGQLEPDLRKFQRAVPHTDRPWKAPEIEALHGAVKGVIKQGPKACSFPELLQSFKSLLVILIDHEIEEEPSVRRIAPSSWTQISSNLTRALLVANVDPTIFDEFHKRADTLWPPKDDEAFLVWVFTVHGHLQGLCDERSLLLCGDAVFKWIKSLYESDFLVTLLARLANIEQHLESGEFSSPLGLATLSFATVIDDEEWYPGPAQMLLVFSRFLALYAPVSTDLRAVAALNDRLLSVVIGHGESKHSGIPQLITPMQNTKYHLFSVLALAVEKGLSDPESAFTCVQEALQANQHDLKSDSALNIVKAALLCVAGNGTLTGAFIKLLPQFCGSLSPITAGMAGKLVAQHITSERYRVTILYTLGNALQIEALESQAAQSEQELIGKSEKEVLSHAASVLSTIASFVNACDSTDIASLASTILTQKFSEVPEGICVQILDTYALIAPSLSEHDLVDVLEQLQKADASSRLKGSQVMLKGVEAARSTFGRTLEPGGQLHRRCLLHFLSLVIEKGETKSTESFRGETTGLLGPIASLMVPSFTVLDEDSELCAHLRDAWLNLSLLWFARTGEQLDSSHVTYLIAIARGSPPLVSGELSKLESELELNPILNRKTSATVLENQRRSLAALSPVKLNRERMMFVAAAQLLERMRVRSGIITPIVRYFQDPGFQSGDGFAVMRDVARELTSKYISRAGSGPSFRLFNLATQIKELLEYMCHRISVVRSVAHEILEAIVRNLPAVLCHRKSLFALLDLVTLTGLSVVAAEEDTYSPPSTFESSRSNVMIELPGSVEVRDQIHAEFKHHVRALMRYVDDAVGLDFRAVLGTYLRDVLDDSRGISLPPAGTALALDFAAWGHSADRLFSEVADFDELVRIVGNGFENFTDRSIETAISQWYRLDRIPMLQAVADYFERSIRNRQGLYNRSFDTMRNAMYCEMQYTPSSKPVVSATRNVRLASYLPHERLIAFLRSNFRASLYNEPQVLDIYVQIARVAIDGMGYVSLHSLARKPRADLVVLLVDIIREFSLHHPHRGIDLEKAVIRAALSWYRQPPQWPYGSSPRRQRHVLQSMSVLRKRLETAPQSKATAIFMRLLELEFDRLEVWLTPRSNLNDRSPPPLTLEEVASAWELDPLMAANLAHWPISESAVSTLQQLVLSEPIQVYEEPSALRFIMNAKTVPRSVIYWAQLSPIDCLILLKPGTDIYLLQLAVRSLQLHPITKCFFYVPQVVQLLRHDKGGFVTEYILEAAKFSSKFAHQIIWNMMANAYRDDDATVPDPMKPVLDSVMDKLTGEFDDEEMEYYEREFGFFQEVTSISGKLKPYIKKSKAEKKMKIDEEMAQIEVPDDVYLPSHPDGTVIDIYRESGKPLQSHAKAPFMASFKLDVNGEIRRQGAIFKVGDDCRQDVLAIQLISVFRSIFEIVGLDVYVFPYKVTATAAGCGIIDVLPDSISRDMLGREAVNGLHEWFLSKHGSEDTLTYQKAQMNFVKSMAAYSVITYLIQFKDRHNGNIMYDDEGHVTHIDFGFCFDITPGGVRFEAAPFKLTKEMVAVMGGSPQAPAYRAFEELTVRAFLASRGYADHICRIVAPMLESGLPCFKGDTLGHLRQRFVLQKNERQAAQYMRHLIEKSYESTFTKGYDEFQRLTNGIPY